MAPVDVNVGLPTQPSRPSMRRKSSAQNLFTFKPGSVQPGVPPVPGSSTGTGAGAGLTMQIPPGTYNSGMGMGIGAPTPTTSTPMNREWDVQSMHSDSVASTTAPLNGSPAISQGTSVEYLRDLVMKRMITLTYMRNVHEGRSHWFHTIMMTKADLERVFNNNAMKKRTYRFAILGMSLSNLFDIQNANDLLKGLLNILNEYEQAKEETYKPKMRGLFRSSKIPKRQVGGMNDYSMAFPDSSETSYLMTPHMPFPLDYHQTLLSLLDILSEVYNKISKVLGPSPFPHSNQTMMGPLGLVSPHPGVSYLFQDSTHMEGEGSLWGIANGNQWSNIASSGGLVSPPAQWTPNLGEMVVKIDGKFKKIISTLLKDLDKFARNGIKDELVSLDPLLRNQAVPDVGREQYDFEGFV